MKIKKRGPLEAKLIVQLCEAHADNLMCELQGHSNKKISNDAITLYNNYLSADDDEDTDFLEFEG